MYLLQSAAVTKKFTFGSAGLTIGIQLSKAGGAYADPSAGSSNLTDAGGGVYTFALTTTDTDTLGTLTYSLVESSTQVSPLTGDIEDDVVAALPSAKDLITLTRAYQNVQGVTARTIRCWRRSSPRSATPSRSICRRDFVDRLRRAVQRQRRPPPAAAAVPDPERAERALPAGDGAQDHQHHRPPTSRPAFR